MKTISQVFRGFVCVCILTFSTQASAVPQENKDLFNAYKVLFPSGKVNKKQTKSAAKPRISRKVPARFKATEIAKKQIRKKYRWGGKSPKTGFDCSGLIQYAFKSVKVNLPRTARAQFKHTKRISLKKLQVGDLIFFHTRRTRQKVNHVGIYLGGNKFIHAPRKGKRVSVADLNRYWRRKAVGAGRV